MECAPNAVVNPAAYSEAAAARRGRRPAGSAAVTGTAASHLVDGLEHQVGVAGQLLGAVLELPGGLGRAGRAEHVAGGQFPVPAAQPVQALLFFFQLGQGELALADLGVDLGTELAAVGDELGPFGLPGPGEP